MTTINESLAAPRDMLSTWPAPATAEMPPAGSSAPPFGTDNLAWLLDSRRASEGYDIRQVSMRILGWPRPLTSLRPCTGM